MPPPPILLRQLLFFGSNSSTVYTLCIYFHFQEYVRRASNFQTAQAKRKLSQKEKVLDKEIEYDESELKGTSLQK